MNRQRILLGCLLVLGGIAFVWAARDMPIPAEPRPAGAHARGGTRTGGDEAREVFERSLFLDPNDHQGIRFLLEDLRAGRTWVQARGQPSGVTYGA